MFFEISEENVNNITNIDYKTVGTLTFELVKAALANSMNEVEAIKKAEASMALLVNKGIVTIYDVSEDELMNDEGDEEVFTETTDDSVDDDNSSPDTGHVEKRPKIVIDDSPMKNPEIPIALLSTKEHNLDDDRIKIDMEDLLNKYDKSGMYTDEYLKKHVNKK